MSYIKIVSDLFMETAELNRLDSFYRSLINDNFKNQASSFGVIKNLQVDPSFNNFKVDSGTNAGTIKLLAPSIGIDKDGLHIHQVPFDNTAIPNDGDDYYAVISHKYDPVEIGLVSISTDGILTGVGTEFMAILRGQPHFPSKIKFYGSASNTSEYTVVEVVSDTSVLLSGQFVAETDLRYSVIGTFTPTAVIPSLDKEVFQYDSCLFRIIKGSVYATLLPLIDGKEFTIAKIYYDTGVIAVEDLRTDIYTSDDKKFMDGTVNSIVNPVIGIECIKWDNSYSTKDKNEVSVAWGFRSDNWTIQSTARTMTLLSGEGGRFKSSSDFTTGDFNGWRIYNKNGEYKKVISSTKSSSSINLVIDSLDVNDYGSGEFVLVVPDVEEVVIVVSDDAAATPVPQVATEYSFPVNMQVAKIYLLVPSATTYLYNIMYRYKRFNRYSAPALLPNDSVGYYDETSFTGGVLNVNPLDRVRYPYTASSDGYIELKANPLSYYTIITSVITGDRFGVDRVTLDPTALQPYQLVVGSSRMYQYFETPPFGLTQDFYINLSSAGCINGNSFHLQFANIPILNGFTLKVVTDYVNPSTYTLISEITSADIAVMSASNLLISVRYDGAAWGVMYSTFDRSAVLLNRLGISVHTSQIAAISGDVTTAQGDITALEAFQTAVLGAWVDASSLVTFEMKDNLAVTSVITASSVFCKYKLIGKTCSIQWHVVVDTSTANTGTGYLYVDMILPAALLAAADDQYSNMSHGRTASSQFFLDRDWMAIMKGGTRKMRMNYGISEDSFNSTVGTTSVFQGSMTFEIA